MRRFGAAAQTSEYRGSTHSNPAVCPLSFVKPPPNARRSLYVLSRMHASVRSLALAPYGRAPLGAVLIGPNSTRPCLCAPVVFPSSSASMLITMPQTSCAGCAAAQLVSDPRAEFVVLFQRAGPSGTPWLKLQQTARGRHLPLEIGAARCPRGCRLKLRTGLLDSPPTGHVVTPSPLKDIHDLHVDSSGYRRGAQRLEFFIRPPLHPVRLSSAQAFTNGLANVCRKGLDPRTSRPRTDLFITRANLALGRRWPSITTDWSPLRSRRPAASCWWTCSSRTCTSMSPGCGTARSSTGE